MAKNGSEYLNSRSKRRFDVIGSVTVGLAMLPALGISYGAAALDNKSARPFFSHERIGEEGKTFTLRKLRTLRPELVTNAYAGEGAYDTRASSIGLVLRRYGLDEIPQLRNIAAGDMSLVGVRASSTESLAYIKDAVPDLFDEWYERAYCAGKPALVGPAQIYRHKFKNPSEEEYRKSLEIDLAYAINASIIRDLRILGSTPFKLIAANLYPLANQKAETEVVLPAAEAA